MVVPGAKEIDMCRAVTCKKCGRTTWAGCGQHVDQVRAGVPKDQWCDGHAGEPSGSGSDRGGLLSRLFGR